ncbi:MAG: hybrid sensor histidine kinase/response regulator [Bacteroidales bacterium]|nr:hybrid sensor histidine kinase/response regulator [Bacteroidales bacterium]MCF8405603.1 hybrid sensor histidine kinase/response regulator [Bacteroidales bacterium]
MNSIKNSILIVDDNQENIKVLVIALSEKDYNLTVAFNGKDALEILNYTPIDLVLLDVMMPGMDGFEVCKRMKADEKMKHIPVIFITALTETSSIVNGFEVGGVDYITKPFKKEELFARVNTQLELQNNKKSLNEKTIKLEQTIESRDKLYAVIAHDLRSPLANIKSILFALTEGGIDQESFDSLVGMLLSSTNETYDLLENLLYWSKNQLNKLEPNKEVFNVGEVINETLNLLKPNADKKGISLECLSNGNVFCNADRNMMKTVLRNLTSNAIKFTPKDGKIMLSGHRDDKQIKFTVEDTGVGITEENIQKLFDKNSNFTTYGTDSEKGSGLGLKLTFEFVNQHNGNILVESTPGSGSKFDVVLPQD